MTRASCMLALVIGAAASADVDVPATTDIFSAGRAEVPPFAGGGGTLAIETPLNGATGVQFLNVTGLTNCCASTPDTPPDGGNGTTNINSYQGVAGIFGPRQLFLAGVFLDDDEPMDPAPERLNFDNIGIEFETLSPEIGQVFFIGDGHTLGNVTQTFVAPTNATRVFIGFADAYAFGGDPGYYDDNTGSLNVLVAPIEGCAADCNQDGQLNILDFVCFQVAWQNQSPFGDCDANGLYNVLDFVCYQGRFVMGCN